MEVLVTPFFFWREAIQNLLFFFVFFLPSSPLTLRFNSSRLRARACSSVSLSSSSDDLLLAVTSESRSSTFSAAATAAVFAGLDRIGGELENFLLITPSRRGVLGAWGDLEGDRERVFLRWWLPPPMRPSLDDDDRAAWRGGEVVLVVVGISGSVSEEEFGDFCPLRPGPILPRGLVLFVTPFGGSGWSKSDSVEESSAIS